MTAVLPARAPARPQRPARPAGSPRPARPTESPRPARPTESPRPARPTLDLGALADLTRRVAADVRAGRHRVVFDPDTRWHRRLYRTERVDVWLISWLPEQGTQLHDHGGSGGAFTVVDGRLDEAVWSAGGLREHQRPAGGTVAFGAHYVHDVRNLSDVPAVSVHAYSAPLTSMNFYDVEHGRLAKFASLDTDDPEAPVPILPDRLA